MSEYTLFPRQAEVRPLLERGPAVLFWDMRLGKTRACLHAFDKLWQSGGPQVAIVVCPSIAKGVWIREQQEMGLQLPIVKLDGITRRRATGERVRGLPALVIVNWDILDAHLADLMAMLQSERCVLILDETHDHCCNPRAQRYRAVRDLAMFADRVWICTGTLYRTSALDVHWQLRLLGPQHYPYYYLKTQVFGERFSYARFNPWSKRTEFKGIKPGVEKELLAIPVIDRRVEELEQAPDDIVWWLDEDERYRYAGGDDQGAMARARSELSELKAKRTVELIKQNHLLEEPLVVFGWHHTFTRHVAASLGGIVLDGNTSAERKTEMESDFRAGKLQLLVINIKAGGMSIDLARARNAVFGEIDWVAANMNQAEARIRGPRQKFKVTYWYVLCSDSVDDFIWRTMLKRGRDMRRLDDHLLSA